MTEEEKRKQDREMIASRLRQYEERVARREAQQEDALRTVRQGKVESEATLDLTIKQREVESAAEHREAPDEGIEILEALAETHLPDYLDGCFGAPEETDSSGNLVIYGQLELLVQKDPAVAGHLMNSLTQIVVKLRELGADPLAPFAAIGLEPESARSIRSP